MAAQTTTQMTAQLQTTGPVPPTTSSALPSTSLIPAINGTVPGTNSTGNGTAPATADSPTTFSGGVVAGVAVACIVGTALLATLITWFVMSSRAKSIRRKPLASSDRRNGRSSDATAAHTEEMATLVVDGGKGMNGGKRRSVGGSSNAPVATGSTAPNAAFLKAILPPNPDDDEVKSRVFAVLDGASIHVDNFYQNRTTALGVATDAELEGFNSPFLAQPVAQLVRACGNPTVVITRALTELVTNAINPAAAASGLSLLPGDLGPLLAEAQRFEKENGNTGRWKEAEAHTYWWRLLTMHLHARATASDPSSPTSTANSGAPSSFPLSTSQRGAAMALAGTFQRAFRPWLRTGGAAGAGSTAGAMAEEEDAALIGLLEAAAALGVWLHSQRSSFEFGWGMGAAKAGGAGVAGGVIETAPALLKVTDQEGGRLRRPKVVLDPVVGRLSAAGR